MWALYFNVLDSELGTNFSTRFMVVLSPPLPHLVGHLLICSNLLTSYTSVYIWKNILNSSLSWSSQTNQWYRLLCFSASYGFTQHFLLPVFETLLCFLLYVINSEDVATMQITPIFFFFFKRLFITCHTLHFASFTSTFFRFLLSFCF